MQATQPRTREAGRTGPQITRAGRGAWADIAAIEARQAGAR